METGPRKGSWSMAVPEGDAEEVVAVPRAAHEAAGIAQVAGNLLGALAEDLGELFGVGPPPLSLSTSPPPSGRYLPCEVSLRPALVVSHALSASPDLPRRQISRTIRACLTPA
jgi:hypothetical protein